MLKFLLDRVCGLWCASSGDAVGERIVGVSLVDSL